MLTLTLGRAERQPGDLGQQAGAVVGDLPQFRRSGGRLVLGKADQFRFAVYVIDDDGRKPVAQFATRIAERAVDQGVLREDRERTVLEDELLAALAQQIQGRVIAARDLTRDMNSDTRSKPMSSGIVVSIRWARSDKITELQRATSRLLERDSPGPERLAELRGLLREMIREYRASHPRATYREALANVLDYRSWHAFELLLIQPGQPEVRLTRARHSVMSGGEKSAAIHLPLFAATWTARFARPPGAPCRSCWLNWAGRCAIAPPKGAY